jgi:hypothetical protein
MKMTRQLGSRKCALAELIKSKATSTTSTQTPFAPKELFVEICAIRG